jgi:hypothetical protein
MVLRISQLPTSLPPLLRVAMAKRGERWKRKDAADEAIKPSNSADMSASGNVADAMQSWLWALECCEGNRFGDGRFWAREWTVLDRGWHEHSKRYND